MQSKHSIRGRARDKRRSKATASQVMDSLPLISLHKNIKESRILGILGEDMFAKFTVVQIPGRVVWCNVDLAREIGFDAPLSNHLTPQLHDQLVRALSWRVLKQAERADGRFTLTMYADKYGGDGVAPALGSARAGFLPYCDLFIKGVGHTPLFKHNDPDDFAHAHGGLNMYQAIAEAVFGEVNLNLFGPKSTRILAIIDQGDHTTYPNGKKDVRAVAARIGNQLRPGHVLAKRVRGDRSRFDVFLAIAAESGQLVTRRDDVTGEQLPDIKATMLRVIDDHARTAAQQARWRIAHRELSTSNMQLDGGMLDINTEHSNPRFASLRPAHDLDTDKSHYADYSDRAEQMTRLYRTVMRSAPDEQRAALNAVPIDIKHELDKAYANHLEMSMLCATGLKTKLAQHIQTVCPDLTRRFTEVLAKLTDLRNPAKLRATRLAIEIASVVDIYNLLQNFPETYFSRFGGNHADSVRTLLRPIYRGNKAHRAKKRARVKLLAEEFVAIYQELMNTAESLGKEFYKSPANMKRSIVSRARFENRPLPLLYRTHYRPAFKAAIARYEATGNEGVLRRIIDNSISESLRSVDALMTQGYSRRLSDNAVEIQIRLINGIRYSVRAWNDENQRRVLTVSIPGERNGDYVDTALPGHPSLSIEQLSSLRYRFTTDKQSGWRDVPVRVMYGEHGQVLVRCDDIQVAPMVGALKGFFYDSLNERRRIQDGRQEFRGYLFAVPDDQELAELMQTIS